jgi:hypothetical protein
MIIYEHDYFYFIHLKGKQNNVGWSIGSKWYWYMAQSGELVDSRVGM